MTGHAMTGPAQVEGAASGVGGVASGVASGAPAGRPVVARLNQVSRTFPGTPPVDAVRAASLTIRAGDYWSIMGTSGSGKSTLLGLLGLLDQPSAGVCEIDGQPTGRLSDPQRSTLRGALIGFVFQGFHLLSHRTVLENVLLGMAYAGTPRAERLDHAWQALAEVGLVGRAHALPPTLSGGERQRAAIARAVASCPHLLLADEPTGNLDAATTGEVLAVFDRLHDGGLAMVVVTHDPAVAARAARHAQMEDGRLREVAP